MLSVKYCAKTGTGLENFKWEAEHNFVMGKNSLWLDLLQGMRTYDYDHQNMFEKSTWDES